MAKIGFIGLGIMGRPMAGHLLAGGHELYVHSRSKPQELIDMGAAACASGRDVARNSDIVITMLPDTPDVETARPATPAWPRGSAVARSSST